MNSKLSAREKESDKKKQAHNFFFLFFRQDVVKARTARSSLRAHLSFFNGDIKAGLYTCGEREGKNTSYISSKCVIIRG